MKFHDRNDTDSSVTLFTMDFLFEKQEYHCLVRAKINQGTVRYAISLLNCEMEEVFTEPYTIVKRGDALYIEAPFEQTIHAGVKFASMVALRKHFG